MGRTANNGSSKLHALVWLKYVQQCYPEQSFYFLDLLFGQLDWKEMACIRKDIATIKKLPNEDVARKPFTRFARNLELPKRYDYSKIKTEVFDLPSRVNSRRESGRSLELYDSKLWTLLKNKPNDVKANEALLGALFKQFGIIEITGKEALKKGLGKGKCVISLEDEGEISVNEDFGSSISRDDEEAVNKAIKNVLRRSLDSLEVLGVDPPLDVLAFYGALYRKAFHKFNDAHIDIYRSYFLGKLDAVLKEFSWLKKSFGKKDYPMLNNADEKFKKMLFKMVISGTYDARIVMRGEVPLVTKQELSQFTYLQSVPKKKQKLANDW